MLFAGRTSFSNGNQWAVCFERCVCLLLNIYYCWLIWQRYFLSDYWIIKIISLIPDRTMEVFFPLLFLMTEIYKPDLEHLKTLVLKENRLNCFLIKGEDQQLSCLYNKFRLAASSWPAVIKRISSLPRSVWFSHATLSRAEPCRDDMCFHYSITAGGQAVLMRSCSAAAAGARFGARSSKGS